MAETPNKHKHLEFIKASINRMSGKLFLLKGWSITLIAGLFALAAKDTNQAYVLIAYFPLLVFWTLDGYLGVKQEQLAQFSIGSICFIGISKNRCPS